MTYSARGSWQSAGYQKRSRDNKNFPSLRPVKLQKRKKRTNERESIEQEGNVSLWEPNYKLSKYQLNIGESNVNKVCWANKRSFPEVSAGAGPEPISGFTNNICYHYWQKQMLGEWLQKNATKSKETTVDTCTGKRGRPKKNTSRARHKSNIPLLSTNGLTEDVNGREGEKGESWLFAECKQLFPNENDMLMECEYWEGHCCIKYIYMSAEFYLFIQRPDCMWRCYDFKKGIRHSCKAVAK